MGHFFGEFITADAKYFLYKISFYEYNIPKNADKKYSRTPLNINSLQEEPNDVPQITMYHIIISSSAKSYLFALPCDDKPNLLIHNWTKCKNTNVTVICFTFLMTSYNKSD